MAPRCTTLAVVALAALVGACDQPSPSAPVEGLASGKPAPSSNFACVFSGNPSLSNSANSYFTVTDDRRAAADLISEMQAARDAENATLARSKGYALLTLVGQVSRGTSPGDLQVGDLLTKQAFNCMYDTSDPESFEGWPNDAHYNFAFALNADAGGAYFVRGGSDPATAPVVGNIADLNNEADPAGGNVSALAPPIVGSVTTWPNVLNQQVLFFGNPVPDGYDWKVLPRDAAFSPYIRVALCQGVNDGGQEYADADMVHQFGVGVLGFVDSDGLCGTRPPFAALNGRGVFSRLASLGRSVTNFLTPEPLQASMSVALSRGGTASGAKGDQFTFKGVPKVNLAVTLGDLLAKNTVKVNTGRFSVTVVVTTPDTDEPVGGVDVRLSGTNNNGVPTNIFEVIDPSYTGCDPNTGKVVPPVETTVSTIGEGGTTAVTKAFWNKTLCVTSTGGLVVNAASAANGNPAAAVGTGKAAQKINVKP